MNKLLLKTIILTIFVLSIFGCGHTSTNELSKTEVKGFIGVASMLSDETIVLHIRSETENEGIVHTTSIYEKNHPQYKYIKQHIGELSPGQEKNIKPFPP